MAIIQKFQTNHSTEIHHPALDPHQTKNFEGNGKKTNGGHSSNRPPVKVDIPFFKPCKILASGVDSLSLSLTVGWRDKKLFEYLAGLKEKAQIINDNVEGILKPDGDSEPWKFNIRPHGVRAYTWLLEGKDYFIKIFNSTKPTPRPSITIEIRSETLWANGPIHSIEYILDLIEGMGADIHKIKSSRIDLCADMMIDAELWNPLIKDQAVTRAKLKNSWDYGSDFTGLSIGRGHISSRLYDKVREICQQSKKFWMFDIWGLKMDTLQDDKKIIRVEFQLRREVIKELIDCDIYTTLEYLDRIWGYCTQEWLKFQDNPGEHHTKRKNLFWWDTVQNGFKGIQKPSPFVRKKAFKQDKKQLCAQIYGMLTSLHAINLEECRKGINQSSDIHAIITTYIDEIERSKNQNFTAPAIISKDVEKKRARYHRIT
jgi:hypothetical protein